MDLPTVPASTVQSLPDEAFDDTRLGKRGDVAQLVVFARAILRRMRRMILPERVFGRLGAH
jgi:hypothetical protein